MKYWGLLAVGLVLVGCTLPGPVMMNAEAPVASVSPTATPVPTPTPTPLKTYEDFNFKFTYPLKWEANDLTLDVFALLMGAKLAPGAAGKATILAEPLGNNGRISLVIFQGRPGSLVYDSSTTPAAVSSEETTLERGQTVWRMRTIQTFKDGLAQNAVILKTLYGPDSFEALFIGAPGVSFAELAVAAEDLTWSWSWK